MMRRLSHDQLLDFRFRSGDLDRELSIRDYFRELLLTLWRQGEGFSGKRPFGNSGWEFDLYRALIEAGAVEGGLDSDGCVSAVDTRAADSLVFNLINRCFLNADLWTEYRRDSARARGDHAELDELEYVQDA